MAYKRWLSVALCTSAFLLPACSTTKPFDPSNPIPPELVAQVIERARTICQFEPVVGPALLTIISAFYPTGVPFVIGANTVAQKICASLPTAAAAPGQKQYRRVTLPSGQRVTLQGRRI